MVFFYTSVRKACDANCCVQIFRIDKVVNENLYNSLDKNKDNTNSANYVSKSPNISLYVDAQKKCRLKIPNNTNYDPIQ